MKLSIVMPVYNEVQYIERIVERVRSVAYPAGVSIELVIVDDCSKDGTRDKLSAIGELPDVKVLLHEKNTGKGGALHSGFAAATGDFVLVQDADLEYDPADIPRLLKPVLDGNADVVFGSRFMSGDSRRVLYFWHSIINRQLTNMCNVFTNLNLTDMEVCYKLVRRELLNRIKLKEKRFGFEPEVTIKLARLRPKPRFYEVGISYAGRTYAEGKKIGVKDGFRALWCILRYGIFG
ncbi:glycosyltransferase family 2 protein [bacterium]|nr:MAG: glycosyltransferase family 2 protein [bacterium]RIK62359.1 MAG: glycosyl transferase [Planctomycetota bacterium]